MTIREAFAKAMMQGLIEKWCGVEKDKDVARRAVRMADLLIAALNEEPKR